jgi:hypothetical protein
MLMTRMRTSGLLASEFISEDSKMNFCLNGEIFDYFSARPSAGIRNCCSISTIFLTEFSITLVQLEISGTASGRLLCSVDLLEPTTWVVQWNRYKWNDPVTIWTQHKN